MSSRPRFVLLDTPLPIDGRSLLGKFVQDYTSPLDRLEPTALPAYVDEEFIYDCGIDTSAALLFSSVRDVSVQGKLDQLFSIGGSRGNTTKRDLSAERISTLRVRDHEKLFDRLASQPMLRAQIESLFSQRGGLTVRRKVYMVVGVKTVCGGAVSTVERGVTRGQDLEAGVPVEGAVLAGLPMGFVGAGFHRSSERSTTYGATHDGDRVFAVEYRVVAKKLLARYRNGPGMRLGNVMSVNWGQGTMGSDEEEDSDDQCSDEDDDSAGERVLPLLTGSSRGVLFMS